MGGIGGGSCRHPILRSSRSRGSGLDAGLSARAGQPLPTAAIDGPKVAGSRPFPRRGAAGRPAEGLAEKSGGWWFGTAGIALALALFGGISLASKRFLPTGDSGPIRVIGRSALSTKHSACLLRVGDRVLIVGIGPQGPPSTLGEITDPLELARLAPRRESRPMPGPEGWPDSPIDRLRPTDRRRRMIRRALLVSIPVLLLALPALGSPPPDQPKASTSTSVRPNGKAGLEPAAEEPRAADPKPAEAATPAAGQPGTFPWSPTADDFKGLKSVALIGLASMAPAALLMFTSFVRINIVLILLRQALGSPQVPGNQVLAALALLLSVIVMKPVGESVYTRAIQPYAAKQISPRQAWEAGSRPIKTFMIEQIKRTNHVDYLWELYDFAEPPRPGRVEPVYEDEIPLRVVAPAFLLSELTTALMIGFVIYLPFLVIDLVVSAVLSAMGLFMLPPSLVAMPLKLVLFVLADGWLLVATALLRTFAV